MRFLLPLALALSLSTPVAASPPKASRGVDLSYAIETVHDQPVLVVTCVVTRGDTSSTGLAAGHLFADASFDKVLELVTEKAYLRALSREHAVRQPRSLLPRTTQPGGERPVTTYATPEPDPRPEPEPDDLPPG